MPAEQHVHHACRARRCPAITRSASVVLRATPRAGNLNTEERSGFLHRAALRTLGGLTVTTIVSLVSMFTVVPLGIRGGTGVLEVLHEREYGWIPFEEISSVEFHDDARRYRFSQPSFWPGLWRRATVRLHRSWFVGVFVPTAYVDTWRSPAFAANGTDWTPVDGRMVVGSGHRTFLVDDRPLALRDIAAITFEDLTRV
jgi:hypothetical protein